MARPSPAFVAPGAILRTYTHQEAAELVDLWLGAFGQAGHGVNMQAYLWHIFSARRYPALDGA